MEGGGKKKVGMILKGQHEILVLKEIFYMSISWL